MKVFRLQAPIYRGASLASPRGAHPTQRGPVRRDALERWRRARSRGLSAEEAARAVGASRASLYRWEKRLEPRSRRPHRQRQPTWTSALMRKIERLRADHPMWGKRRLAVPLRREGIDVSVSMVGRILTKLRARGVVTPVPLLRRKPGPRHLRITGQRPAKRLPKGMKPIRPGELVQIDTLFVNVAPDKAVKHFTAYDPVAKWTVALVAGPATPARAPAPPARRRTPPRQAHRRGPLPHRGHPSRWRVGVQGRVRGRLPRAQPVPLRPAAEAAPAQRPRRTRPRLRAIRVLRRRRSPVPPQTPPAPHRRLPPSLQSHKASPSPWRSHPSRVPLNHQPGDRPVSHGLNSDTRLRRRANWLTFSAVRARKHDTRSPREVANPSPGFIRFQHRVTRPPSREAGAGA